MSLEVLEDRVVPAAIWTVNALGDAGAGFKNPAGGGGAGDLRFCMNNAGNGDTITFQVGGTVQLTKALPDISQNNLTIDGAGQNVTIKGGGANNPFRIFTVDLNVTAEIKNLWITDGYDTSGTGGGIRNNGNLAMYNDNLDDNITTGDGGGISNGWEAKLTLSGVTLSGNNASGTGGGLYNAGGTVTICCNSNIVANTSSQGGGGIYTVGVGSTLGTVTCYDDTQISGNSDDAHGGGVMINQNGDFIMYGGNIAYNYDAGNGGGLYNAAGGIVDLESGVTVQNNTAFQYGGGMFPAANSVTTLDTVTVQNNKLTLSAQMGGKGVGIYWQNISALTYTNLTDTDDRMGKPVQGN